jgi:hypothetical protein
MVMLTALDHEGEPFWITPGDPFETPAVAGPVSKARREDLQIWSFLASREGGVRRATALPQRPQEPRRAAR